VGIHDDFPHARVVVTEVMDGDTIRISPPVKTAGGYRSVVVLADIDAPEPDEEGVGLVLKIKKLEFRVQ